MLDADLATKDRVELFLSMHPYSLYETIKSQRNRSSCEILHEISMQKIIWITAKQRFTSVTQSSSEQGMSLSDTIQLSIYCRVPIWISFYVKTRQKVHRHRSIKESSVRVYCNHLSILKILC